MPNEYKLSEYIDAQEGFRLDNIHLKIGSKIHSNQFFYARRLFHNSYYTTRIALLLAKRIDQLLGDAPHILLLGYERYSELLLGLIAGFLEKLGRRDVKHFVMIEQDDGHLSTLRSMSSLSSDGFSYECVVVVPIVSTGSTSEKIFKEIQEKGLKISGSYFFHVLSVTDTMHPEMLVLGDNVHTLISLQTHWLHPSDCDYCFNDKRSRPLIETDKTALTPVLHFGLPEKKTIPIDDSGRNVCFTGFTREMFRGSLMYMPDKKYGGYRLYAHDTVAFIKNNEGKVRDWLKSLATTLDVRQKDRVIILSPCKLENMTFVNLVNEVVFGSSATVLYHQPSAEFEDNFKLFSSAYMKNGDILSKVFFVDDNILSGNTFFTLYSLYRDMIKGEEILSGALFLFNKASVSTNEQLTKSSHFVRSFVSINHLSVNMDIQRECSRYQQLSRRVLRDELRYFFRSKFRDISCIEKHEDSNKERHLRMFEASHRLMDFFSDQKSVSRCRQESFEVIFFSLMNRKPRVEDKMAVMKVMCRSPFFQYHYIRDLVFQWHKLELDQTLIIVDSEARKGKYDPLYVEYLLFLTCRAVSICNYRIVASDFFQVMDRVFTVIDKGQFVIYGDDESAFVGLFSSEANREESLDRGSERLKRLLSSSNLTLLLLRLYAELMDTNPWCSRQISKNLEPVHFNTAEGRKFKRKVLDETTVTVNSFYDMFVADSQSRALREKDFLRESSEEYAVTCDEISRVLDGFEKLNKFQLMNSVFPVKDKTHYAEDFLAYIWLRLFFAQDKNDKKGMLLHDKTERIFSCMHHLFPGNVGFFMVVLDNGDRHRLVYDRDAQSYAILKNRFEQDTIKKAFKEAFLPYDQCVSTIWLLRRETGGQWKDSEENICFDFGPIGDATTLCLVRIGDIEKDKHPVGILGVYSKDRDTISERSMKLLLSLRQVLYEFVHLHHRNNEFVDLWLTEAQARFAYLAGHGRVLMQALSREDDSFGPVVSTMEHLQYVLNIVREKDRRKELINHTFHQSEFDGNRALSLVETVYEYAKKIYASDYAEMRVACKFGQIPHSVEDGGKKVSFSMDILRAICFELVINAKKNRFHFVDDCYRKATSYQSNSLPVNTFSTSVVFEKTYVCIDVSATGSRVPDNRKRIIETGQANKPDEEVSGIDLIYSLITVFNKKNRIMIESERVEDLPLVYLNTVSIRLYYD